MSIKQRVEKLEETLGAGMEPELVVIKLVWDDCDGEHEVDRSPTEEQQSAKLAELMARNPGLSTHFAVWQCSPGEWHSQAAGHGGSVSAIQRP